MQRVVRVQWAYLSKDAECGASSQEEKRKTKERIRGCTEGGHAEVLGVEMDADDPLWRPLQGTAETAKE